MSTKTLREFIEFAVYETMGVDPDRVPCDEGVEYVVSAVVHWLHTDAVREAVYAAQSQVGGPPGQMIQTALARLAIVKPAVEIEIEVER